MRNILPHILIPESCRLFGAIARKFGKSPLFKRASAALKNPLAQGAGGKVIDRHFFPSIHGME